VDAWRGPADSVIRQHHVRPVGPLRAPVEAAIAFGLPEREAWAAVIEVCEGGSRGAVENPLDELSAALARRILERRRSA
jgi:hypothetical protein